MERILRILDVSSYMHAGAVNKFANFRGPVTKTDNGYEIAKVPAGGISLVFNEIHEHFGRCDYIFCCDRMPTIKQGMYTSYKISREHKKNIAIQKEIAETVLQKCGFTVLYDDGYEADDFIYSCVKAFKKEYDRVYIHTGDSDLYFLVDDKVSIAKSHSGAKEVNMQNYSVSCTKGLEIQYNTCTLRKVLYGDSSDDIPAMAPNEIEYLTGALFTPLLMPLHGDKEVMRSVIESVAQFALPQFDLVFPLDTEVPDEILPGSWDMVCAFGAAMNNKHFRDMARESTNSTVQSTVTRFINKGFVD